MTRKTETNFDFVCVFLVLYFLLSFAFLLLAKKNCILHFFVCFLLVCACVCAFVCLCVFVRVSACEAVHSFSVLCLLKTAIMSNSNYDQILHAYAYIYRYVCVSS